MSFFKVIPSAVEGSAEYFNDYKHYPNMKAIFIAYNQAYYMEIVELLEANGCRGYTMWENVSGRGSETGEPHLGNHAWPTMNNALLTFVDDSKAPLLLSALSAKDAATPELGLRAFSWTLDNLKK